MEFNGFVSADFDFLKKKEKMTKEEYDKSRNDFKLHFRKFCYEVQKHYHKTTNGVLELDKEFHGFSKKSEEIVAFNNLTERSKLKIFLDSDFLGVSIEFKAAAYEDVLTNKKDAIWDFLLSNKHTYIEFFPNSKNAKNLRLFSHELNSKNYENFVLTVKKISNKETSTIQIGYLFNKNECIKLGKDLVRHSYEAIVKIQNFNEIV